MKRLVAGIAAVFLIGTLGYYYLEDGWSLFDSFYMVAITITTVGFGEIHKLSVPGRIFTIFLIFVGFGGAVAFATQLARLVIEGELGGYMGKRKMNDRIRKTSEHYIICGHGRTGSSICKKLHEVGIPFVVVEISKEALSSAKLKDFMCVEGNPSSDVVLLSAGIERASGIVICVSDDAATIFIALAARELNPNIYIIAQSGDPSIESRFIRAGADTVVYPLRLGGEQVARLITAHCGLDTSPAAFTTDSGVLGYYLRIFRKFGDGELTVGEVLDTENAIKAIALRTEMGEEILEPGVKAKLPKNSSLVLLVKSGDSMPVKLDSSSKEMIVWSEELMIGITSIDEEHRSLVVLANKFQRSLKDGLNSSEVEKLFEKLIDYTDKHFVNEEKIMKKYSYPDLDNHKLEHKRLIQEVLAMKKDQKYIFHENISDFLYSWLVEHIIKTDLKFGKYLSEKDSL